MDKKIKISFIGPQGSGKTTLMYKLAHKLKINNINVSILSEVARSCPFEINENVSDEAQFWILSNQLSQEQSIKGGILLTDRSLMDPLAYGIRRNPKLFRTLIPFVKEYMKTYDAVIYLPPNDNYLIDDGIRSVNKEFRDEIDSIMRILIEEMQVPLTTYDEVYEKLIGDKK